MKTFKLWVHQQNFSEEELVINPCYFPGQLSVGDVLEIYHPEDELNRLLLTVNSLSTEFQQKDTISVNQSVANAFQLRAYIDVCVNKVDPSLVTLDMVELIYRDQYISRSDMWRIQKFLSGSCVYVSKKVSFAGIRLQVNEMWLKGVKVSCGVLGKDTKMVFRSQSSQIHLFIQMSAEMWEFDFFGDLYFEKTVNGFLSELYAKWKEMNCNHEVTIVLFSRTIYDAKSLDEFPKEMQSSIVHSHDGKFHQDFYKMVMNSEICDNWKSVVLSLKRSLNNYLKWVDCDGDSTSKQPPRRNSRSSEGNVLEAINMSLNVFEKYYIDCRLEQCNSTVVVITPGSGVFEVDRELTSITKQRLTNSGFGADLVCLAEQPLHAVPLLKFHSKKAFHRIKGQPVTIDYNIPQWINLSFYSSPVQRNSCSKFIPRMKVPEKPVLPEDPEYFGHHGDSRKKEPPHVPEPIDFDEYDAQVFDYPTPRTALRNKMSKINQKRAKSDHYLIGMTSPDQGKYGRGKDMTKQLSWGENEKGRSASPTLKPARAHSESEDIRLGTSVGENMIFLDDDTLGASDNDQNKSNASSTNLADYYSHQTGLINPFRPYYLTYKRTLFRHRWLHAFPTDLKGEAMQEHHQKVSYDQDTLSPKELTFDEEDSERSLPKDEKFASPSGRESESPIGPDREDVERNKLFKVGTGEISMTSSRRSSISEFSLKIQPEEDWTTTIMTGVDWKSLTCPACLPTSTDYFPDQKTFEDDYLTYNYKLIMEESYPRPSPGCHDRYKMTPDQKFQEIISQRLGQGFQFVSNKEKLKFLLRPNERNRHSIFLQTMHDSKEEFVLSHVQQIHHVQFLGTEISVSKYVKKHTPSTKPLDYYKYKLWSTNDAGFQGTCTEFPYEDSVMYNWNYLDHYVTDDAEDCDGLIEDLKYWRVRYLLLPLQRSLSKEGRYSGDLNMIRIELFLKFLEGLNKIRRPQNQRMLFLSRQYSVEDKQRYREFRDVTPLEHSKSSEKRPSGQHHSKRSEKGDAEGADKGRNISSTSHKEGVHKDGDSTSGDTKDKKGAEKQKGQLFDEVTASEGDKQLAVGEKIQSTGESSDFAVACPTKLPPEHALTLESPLEDIIKAMQNTEYGLSFLPKQANLRQWTFISGEAVAWMIKSIDGVGTKEAAVLVGQVRNITTAFTYNKKRPRTTDLLAGNDKFQPSIWNRLLEAKLILRASSCGKENFIDGFFLYFIVEEEKPGEKRKPSSFSEELQLFEVAVWREKPLNNVPEFLQHTLRPESPSLKSTSGKSSPREGKISFPRDSPRKHQEPLTTVPNFQSMEYMLDLDHKSDRAEWCTVHYSGNYIPTEAFSIELQWMVSTGCIVNERVQQWARKATPCGFHLIPAPVCPFTSHSNQAKKSPLIKPGFISLNIECLLTDGQKHLFQDFEKTTWSRRMVLFQEAVLLKFGFLRDSLRSTRDHCLLLNQSKTPRSYQFVHSTGNVFIRIIDKHSDVDQQPQLTSQKLNFEEPEDLGLNSYKESSRRVQIKVNKLLLDLEAGFDEEKYPTGFFWLHNVSLSKKWRSNVTGDLESANRLIQEFSQFCANEDGKLKDFWDDNIASCKEIAKEESHPASVIQTAMEEKN